MTGVNRPTTKQGSPMVAATTRRAMLPSPGSSQAGANISSGRREPSAEARQGNGFSGVPLSPTIRLSSGGQES